MRIKNRLKKYIISLCFCFLCLFSTFSVCASGGLFTYDDRASFITYSARTATITSVGYNGTASRIARGNNAMFDFYGSQLYIYAVTYTNSGRARIYIDGSPFGYTPSGVSSSYSQILAYSITNLTPGKHTCSIEAWDSTVSNPSGTSVTAYFFLDYIETSKDVNTTSVYETWHLILLTVGFGIYLVTTVIQFGLWRLTKNDR